MNEFILSLAESDTSCGSVGHTKVFEDRAPSVVPNGSIVPRIDM